MKLLIISVLVIVLNLPFGYWRANVKKFSFQWFLAIHLPVPFIILLRILCGLGFAFITYPVLIGADLLGNYAGGEIYSYKCRISKGRVTSCMFFDLFCRSS